MVNYKEPLEFMGVPGSPYTRKMLALLRYRRLRYRLLPGSRHRAKTDVGRYRPRPEPKVPLLPTFYGLNDSGSEVAVCDSTPLIREFEALSPERSVIPDQPALALINSILEDYGDEWLTKAMFHYRWSYQTDIDKAAQMLPRWNNLTASEEEMANKGKEISELQISRLRYVGSNEVTGNIIENSFLRFLELFDKHLNLYPFLLGGRPGSGDFAVYGQLTCMALFDPTPQRLILEQAPRVYAWTEVMEDLSGHELLENDWIVNSGEINELPASLTALLAEIGIIYVSYLLANASAVQNQQAEFKTKISGHQWEQQSFPYQYKCLKSLRSEWLALDIKQKSQFTQLISGTDVGNLFTEP